MTQEEATGDYVADQVRFAGKNYDTGTVDGYEDNDLSEYVGDTGSFHTQSSTVYDGTYALEDNTTSDSGQSIGSATGLERYPEPGDVFSVRYQTTGDTGGFNIQGRFAYGVQDETNVLGDSYAVNFDTVNGSVDLFKRSGGSETTLDTASISVSTGIWYTFEIYWSKNGDHTVIVYDGSDSVVTVLSANDSEHGAGAIGYYFTHDGTQGVHHWDEVEIINTDRTVGTGGLTVGNNKPVDAMLANSLRSQKALADDGSLYDTVKEAVMAASSYVFVPPGTFNEPFTVTTDGMTIQGSGPASSIEVNSTNAITVRANDVTIADISITVNDTEGSGAYGGVVVPENIGVSGTTIDSVYYPSVDHQAVLTYGESTRVINNIVETSPNGNAFSIRGVGNHKVIGCVSKNTDGFDGIFLDGDDSIIAFNHIRNSGTGGGGVDNIQVNGNDCIIIGNRCDNPGDFDIDVTSGSTENIIANNRLSSYNDSGTGTVSDANLVDPSN